MRGIRIPLVVAAAAIFVGTAAPAAAQAPPAAPPRLDVDVFVPSDPELPTQLVATLRTADGSSVSGAIVSFSLPKQLLGERFASIGTGVTDATGSARVAFTPRTEEVPVRVSFAGDGATPAVATEATLTFPADRVVAASIPHHVHGLLTPVRRLMPPLISGGVAVLWVFLIFVVAGTVARIRRDGLRKAVEEAVGSLDA